MSTENDVYALLDEWKKAGKPTPTLRVIRENLGTGSMTTIARAVQTWKSQNEPAYVPPSSSDFPEDPNDETKEAIIKAVWAALRPQLNARLSRLKVELGRDLQAAQAQLATVTAERDNCQRMIADQENQIRVLTDQLKQEQEARARAEGAYEAIRNLQR